MGTLFRLFLLFAAIWAVVYLIRSSRRAPQVGNRAPRDVRVVRCAQCGVHVPEPEAVRSQGRDYCSIEHRNLGPGGY